MVSQTWVSGLTLFGDASTFRAHSRVAQVVEQVTVNHRVGGSSPSSGAC